MNTNQALRAYAGSQVAMRFGIYEAPMWLRHSTMKITERYDSHFVSQFKPQELERIAARWAIAPADVTLDVTPDFRQAPQNPAMVLPWKQENRN